jgi:hypothetical protein
MKRDRLDFQFQSECPACGETAGWTGESSFEGGRRWLELACPRCNNRFDELNPEWERSFDASPPTFRPGT